jgi:hypothetical protein
MVVKHREPPVWRWHWSIHLTYIILKYVADGQRLNTDENKFKQIQFSSKVEVTPL